MIHKKKLLLFLFSFVFGSTFLFSIESTLKDYIRDQSEANLDAFQAWCVGWNFGPIQMNLGWHRTEVDPRLQYTFKDFLEVASDISTDKAVSAVVYFFSFCPSIMFNLQDPNSTAWVMKNIDEALYYLSIREDRPKSFAAEKVINTCKRLVSVDNRPEISIMSEGTDPESVSRFKNWVIRCRAGFCRLIGRMPSLFKYETMISSFITKVNKFIDPEPSSGEPSTGYGCVVS